MTTRHTFPQPGDTNDAAKFAQHLGRDNITDYVATGMDFNVDYTVPEVTVTDGKAYASRENATATLASEDLNYGFDYVFEFTQRTTGLVDNALNYVWLDGQIGTDDSPEIHTNTTGTEPVDTTVLLGVVDTSDNTYELGNRDPDATFEAISSDSSISGGASYTVPSGYRMDVGDEYEINGTLDIEQGAVFETETRHTNDRHYGGIRADRGLMHRTTVPAGQTLYIPEGYTMFVTDDFSVEGTLDVDGSLKYVRNPTEVEEYRTVRARNGLMHDNTVEANETLSIPEGYEMFVGDNFTVDGELDIDGELTFIRDPSDVEEFGTVRSRGGLMMENTIETDETLTVPEGFTMLVSDNFDVDGNLDVEGEVLSIPDSFGITINNLDGTSVVADGSASPGFDGSFSTNISDETQKFDVVVSVNGSTGLTYSYNVDVGKRWNGSNWEIETTINWNDAPSGDVPFDVEVQNR